MWSIALAELVVRPVCRIKPTTAIRSRATRSWWEDRQRLLPEAFCFAAPVEVWPVAVVLLAEVVVQRRAGHIPAEALESLVAGQLPEGHSREVGPGRRLVGHTPEVARE